MHGETSQPKEGVSQSDLLEVGIGITSEAHYTILGYSSVVIKRIEGLPWSGLVPSVYFLF